MARRVNLPGASELFRPTDAAVGRAEGTQRPRTTRRRPPAERSTSATNAAPSSPRAASGRVRHDEKITVYVSGEELLALEQARLALRAEQRLAVDRGRIVRAAVALALEDLAAHGEDSELVRRLREQ